MQQKKKDKIITSFVKRYKKKGYSNISVKEDPILPDTYIVSASEPLANRVITTHLKLQELQR